MTKKITLTAFCRDACCVLLLAVFSQQTFAQSKANQLAGFSKVTTLVAYNATGKSPFGITEERLKTILELKLRANGLRVLTAEEDLKDPSVNPYVFLEVSTLESRNKAGNAIGFAYGARLSIRLVARVPINESFAPIELWARDTMGVSGTEQAPATTEKIVNELTEELLNDWLAANPRR